MTSAVDDEPPRGLADTCQSQVIPAVPMTWCTCAHAALNAAGCSPQEYQRPLGSGATLSTTGRPIVGVCARSAVSQSSCCPAVIDARLSAGWPSAVGVISMTGRAPAAVRSTEWTNVGASGLAMDT